MEQLSDSVSSLALDGADSPPFVRDPAEPGRKSRRGSENRKMAAKLGARYDPEKLRALEAAAGSQLPTLIRECADLLLRDLLPVARERGVDPVILLRQTARAVAATA